ncbi:MAG: class A beta-lactamase-related serine hydrolase [Eubacteriaceae bacterium]|nr:class A beta-lactamase-related serine hydrolase [Eubacteriaceae bacterium]
MVPTYYTIANDIGKLLEGCDAKQVGALWSSVAIGNNEVFFEKNKSLQVSSASLIKVPIMCAILDLAAKGDFSLKDMVEAKVGDILDDSYNYDNGPRQTAIAELLFWMVANSDNTATNILVDYAGFNTLNSYFEKIGLEQTSLGRKMLDFDKISQGINNHTSLQDMHKVFCGIYNKSILDRANCEFALSVLSRQSDRMKIRRYLWESGLGYWHKSGGLDYLSHDAGIFVASNKPFFLGFVFTGTHDKEGEPKLIGTASRLVFDFYLHLN